MQENRFRSARGSGLPFTQTNAQLRGTGPLVLPSAQPQDFALPYTQTNAQLRGTGPLVLPSAQGFEENLNERSVPLWNESSPQ